MWPEASPHPPPPRITSLDMQFVGKRAALVVWGYASL